MYPVKFAIEPKKVLHILLAGIAIIAIAHIASQWYLNAHPLPPTSTLYTLLAKFGLDDERGLGTWFSQTILMVGAGLLFIICTIKHKQKNTDAKYWGALGVIFIYLSIDEGISLHELAVAPTQRILGIGSGYLFFAWVIPALIILIGVSLFFLKFWWRLPRQTKILLLVSLGIFLSGSVGIELIESNYFSVILAWDVAGSAIWTTLILTEECLEMLGTSLFIYALLQYIALPGRKITAQLTQPR